jgi:hypothetical protein
MSNALTLCKLSLLIELRNNIAFVSVLFFIALSYYSPIWNKIDVKILYTDLSVIADLCGSSEDHGSREPISRRQSRLYMPRQVGRVGCLALRDTGRFDDRDGYALAGVINHNTPWW